MDLSVRIRGRAERAPRPGAVVVIVAILTVLSSAAVAAAAPPRFDARLTSAMDPILPAITKVAPETGPPAGGTMVSITGSNFSGTSEVRFGAVSASFSLKSANKIEATAPPGAEGAVDVTVTTPEGTSQTTSADRFFYVPPGPSVVEVTPGEGSVEGGKEVKVLGAHFDEATEVLFGGANASFEVLSSEAIRAVSPVGSMPTVDVRVRTPEGISPVSTYDRFTYVTKIAEISEVSPKKGPAAGGNTVTISGSYFYGVTGVQFGGGGETTEFTSSPGQITVVAPPDTEEKVFIQVESTFGPSSPEWCVHRGNNGASCSVRDGYRYQEPTVMQVTPANGPAAGGTPVTILGSGFGLAPEETEVLFGKTPATEVTCSSSTSCTAVTPPGKAKATAVKVHIKSNAPKTSKTNPAAEFVYE